MRSIYKIVVCSLLTLSITSCEKDLLEKEQYQKEIYLIGAYNRVWTTEVSYSNEEVKTYFTVSSSGTLALDRDVNVKMKINEELVDIYNKKYWTVLNEDTPLHYFILLLFHISLNDCLAKAGSSRPFPHAFKAL